MGAELYHDAHDKELLAIFESFKNWPLYLESPLHTIDVITDHKVLEYLASTEALRLIVRSTFPRSISLSASALRNLVRN